MTASVLPELLQERMRAAFRDYPTGVSIATAADDRGHPGGLTLSSLASVSVAPPALSLSVMNGSPAAEVLLGAPTFLVHLLDARHAGLARLFATAGADKFGGATPWTPLPTGEPLLDDVGTVLRCRSLEQVRVGASTVVIGEVLDVLLTDGAHDPLVHVRRRFHPVPPGTSLPA